MRFDDKQVDVSGVSDRRGRGGAVAAGGGVGVAGLLVYLLVNLLGGGDSLALQIPSGTQVDGESQEQLAQRCNAEGAIERHNDCFLIKVSNEIDEVWTARLEGYERPTLTFFEQGVQTACGSASSQVGPFYCPGDRSMYIDLGFLKELQKDYGAEGRYAQAYILAHETGHHIQTLLGTERRVRRAQQSRPSDANQLSVRMELQADCFAGLWGKMADEAGNLTITEAELDQALGAAAAIGDDRIQERTRGRVDPESWTHGSAEQRRSWYLRGFKGNSLEDCDTFRS